MSHPTLSFENWLSKNLCSKENEEMGEGWKVRLITVCLWWLWKWWNRSVLGDLGPSQSQKLAHEMKLSLTLITDVG